MAGIYFHIPFCKQACHYCDFHFSTNQEKKGEMVGALVRELELQKSYLAGETIETVYFGGGTPSLLSVVEIETLLEAVAKTYSLAPTGEITLEANPDDLHAEKLVDLRAAGVNRLSIGIQSFDDRVLHFLHRAHSASAAQQCLEQARAAGFDNISLDLIYAIPGQPVETWRENIRRALSFAPEHISSYSLTIEEKTAFGKWAATGKLKAVEDDLAAAQLEMLVEMLDVAGYEQYEVSNFARPGYYSRHNSSYWQQKKYLGIGPSAHSYDGQSRQYNVANNHVYLRGLQEDKIPFTHEALTPEDVINEYLLTTLRTSWGADLRKLRQELQYDLQALHGPYLNTLFAESLAIVSGDTLQLTRRGKMLADKIAADLFATK
ncbi:radical SAM family heme chaperone HemW [Parachryseolinea silvisoli]|uniref:radical SAM family heme chaperone HemW n=1 Tax=Parachryseolinea silvisoli TaxID=2873601 RepID=UPI002265CB44|nr:radical SAM family heme chaperone HemW [Parachryseolinea silvisoli]MCD9016142.1 radical SAM family heme chaperone HemW [Parachryseolinea silvisoli]